MIGFHVMCFLREKIQEEKNRAQYEADIKIRNGEVQTAQKELDSITATLQQLENQKKEAQKRLDELDDKASTSFKKNVYSWMTLLKIDLQYCNLFFQYFSKFYCMVLSIILFYPSQIWHVSILMLGFCVTAVQFRA